MPDRQRIGLVIVAAGSGIRAAAGANGVPKQYADVGGKPLVAWTIGAFSDAGHDFLVQPVISAGHGQFIGADSFPGALPPVAGGATRQQSVLNGLEALQAHDPKFILVHDAVRPFVEPDLIARVVGALDDDAPAVVPVVRPVDTLRRADASGLGEIVSRDETAACQTPQGFRFADLLAAHRRAADAGLHDFTDDAAVMAWAGHALTAVEGAAGNTKVTLPGDLALARLQLAGAMKGKSMETRTGTGFDVHRFAAGRELWLCGVKVPHELGLSGHSDADVGLHALTDALLGALADGDIGQHFPPSDPQWKDARSDRFLADAAHRVARRGGRIVNVDVTLLCEAPRIGPHRDSMRAAIAAILGIDAARVGVKATTTEGLGFAGRREGIAAQAVATIEVPSEETAS
ncbi:MAG: bifunctional 2-C-methyl-D-erythritol 4-phosphate cytidylyltransferase/2-C-methyl-D-erythritol 2,4-cyclodiphosphate synthase [Flavobacteriaceae bacterium]